MPNDDICSIPEKYRGEVILMAWNVGAIQPSCEVGKRNFKLIRVDSASFRLVGLLSVKFFEVNVLQREALSNGRRGSKGLTFMYSNSVALGV